MFDTKIAIVVRDDLPVWQKLNVTAVLMRGIVCAAPGIIGERYKDAAGNLYSSLCIQPVIVLAADQQTSSMMIEPPSRIKGSAFWTVNSTAFGFRLKTSSTSSSLADMRTFGRSRR